MMIRSIKRNSVKTAGVCLTMMSMTFSSGSRYADFGYGTPYLTHSNQLSQ
jgi:hypothetical protein